MSIVFFTKFQIFLEREGGAGNIERICWIPPEIQHVVLLCACTVCAAVSLEVKLPNLSGVGSTPERRKDGKKEEKYGKYN
jgi:hypothetical protein